jgi:hypothetical protein
MSKNQVTGEPIELQEIPMFADRKNLSEAFEYASDIIENSMQKNMKIHGYTAVYVILNTLANKYHLIKK